MMWVSNSTRAACLRATTKLALGEPDVKVQGSDLTILSIGATLYRVMEAVKLFAEHGISVEVIDARRPRAVQLREGHRVREEDG